MIMLSIVSFSFLETADYYFQCFEKSCMPATCHVLWVRNCNLPLATGNVYFLPDYGTGSLIGTDIYTVDLVMITVIKR